MKARVWVTAMLFASVAFQASADSQQNQNSQNPYQESGALHHLYEASKGLAKLARPSIVQPIERLVSNDRARSIMIRHLGWDIATSPDYEQFKTMSLLDVAQYSGGAITDDMLRRIETDFEGLTLRIP
jgi:hypothetical protein